MYGRAYLYRVCITLFVVFSIACAVANSLGALIVFRFFAGVMGSCPITVGTGSIADTIPAEKRAAALGAYVLGVGKCWNVSNTCEIDTNFAHTSC